MSHCWKSRVCLQQGIICTTWTTEVGDGSVLVGPRGGNSSEVVMMFQDVHTRCANSPKQCWRIDSIEIIRLPSTPVETERHSLVWTGTLRGLDCRFWKAVVVLKAEIWPRAGFHFTILSLHFRRHSGQISDLRSAGQALQAVDLSPPVSNRHQAVGLLRVAQTHQLFRFCSITSFTLLG